MTAGLATRSAARTRRAPAAQSGLQIRMCLGQHQGGVPIFGSVAHSPERPFGRPQGPAGRLRVQVPSDPPIPTAERPSKEGRFRFPIPRRAIRSAGGFLPDGVKGARRPVKPSVPVRVRVRQPVFRSQGASDLHAAPRRRRFVVQVHVGAPAWKWEVRRSKWEVGGEHRARVRNIPTSPCPRMQRVAQPAFHAGPSRCEPGRGHHFDVGHDVVVASRAVTAAGLGANPAGQPTFRSPVERQPNQTCGGDTHRRRPIFEVPRPGK